MKPIVQEGAPILRKVAKPVPEKLFGSPELSKILEQMKEALDAEPDGVALAAPQIGFPYRIFIIRMDRTLPPPRQKEGEKEKVRLADVAIYINPEITKRSRKKQEADEGCLSVRGIYGVTKRHEKATIRAQHEDGKHFTRGGGGLLAQIFEHEVDHLNGILFIDHATKLVELKPEHLKDENE